jgi:hypothetical protein
LLPLADALRKLILESIKVTDDMTNAERLFKLSPPLVLWSLEGLLALAGGAFPASIMRLNEQSQSTLRTIDAFKSGGGARISAQTNPPLT